MRAGKSHACLRFTYMFDARMADLQFLGTCASLPQQQLPMVLATALSRVRGCLLCCDRRQTCVCVNRFLIQVGPQNSASPFDQMYVSG